MQPLIASDFDVGANEADVDISGKILDESGEELVGATVIVKGETRGTVTDINGNYTITVDESAILLFSFVGYTTIEESIGGRSVINVELTRDITTLGEVVVTGYQTLFARKGDRLFRNYFG